MLTKGSPVADIIVVLTQAAQEESDYRDREKRSARKRTNEATRRVTA